MIIHVERLDNAYMWSLKTFVPFVVSFFFLFLGNYLSFIVSSSNAKVAALLWFDLNLNFGASYICRVGPYTPAPNQSISLSWTPFSPFLPLPLFLPLNPHVHPVNYFVSGYLQRAVNSCRADYTDRFIALVSQSNVCNAPIPTTHSLSLMLFLSSFVLSVFSRLFLWLLRVVAYFSHISNVCEKKRWFFR